MYVQYMDLKTALYTASTHFLKIDTYVMGLSTRGRAGMEGAARGGVRPRPTASQSPVLYTSTGAGLCLKVVHTRRRWCVTFRRAGVCWRWDWCSSEHHFDGALRGFANDLRPGAPCTLTQKPHNFPRFNTGSVPRCLGRSAVLKSPPHRREAPDFCFRHRPNRCTCGATADRAHDIKAPNAAV